VTGPDAPRPPRSTSAQLRDDIDSGRTGDKVPWSDPAAAPLGTDEEAAGTPPSPADVEAARMAERRSVRADTLARGAGPRPPGLLAPVLSVLAVMVLLAALAVALG
jgi:hypothetical protein